MPYSQRFLANLGGSASVRWLTECAWSNDGGMTWKPSTWQGGSATCSLNSQVHWSSEITLADVPYGRDGINPYQTRYRLRHGMKFSEHEAPEWVGMGVYAVTEVGRSSDARGVRTIRGESFETYLIRSRFLQPRTIRPELAQLVAERLIREVLPKALIDWDTRVRNDLILPKLVGVADRWATLDGDRDATSIAKALAARLYHDENGIWRVVPVPTISDPVAWELHAGSGGVSLGVAEQLSSEGVTNVEIVFGSPSGSGVIGPGIAQDLNPASFTYVGRSPDEGGYGVVPADEYSSQMITSRAQAEQVARARLSTKLGLRQQVSFGQLHDPTKRAGQVGIVHTEDGPVRCILDAVTFDLSSAPGPITAETRTTQTRLDGVVNDYSNTTWSTE